MTPNQIQLVSTTWAAVRPISDTAARLFYQRLFELDPSLRPMFRGDLEQQGRMLMAALNLAVTGLSRWETLQPALCQLGARHAGYGVQPAHYDTVGAALLWTLHQGLGEACTPEVVEAWAAAYAAIAGVMQAASADAESAAVMEG